MKTAKLLPGLMVAMLTAGFLSCTKTDTVLHNHQTLVLSATKDASIFLQNPVTNTALTDNGSGASDLLRVGYVDNGSYYVRTLVAFDVSPLPKTAIIDEVTLSFTMSKAGIKIATDTVLVHKITQQWSEGTTDDLCEYSSDRCHTPGAAIVSGGGVTWTSASHGTTVWTTAGGTFASTASATNYSGVIPSFSSAGLIADVKAWRDDPTSNNGWLLKLKETYLQKNGGEQIRYYSREASTTKAGRSSMPTTGAEPSTKPTLTIIYH